MSRSRRWVGLLAVVVIVLYAGPALAAEGDDYWTRPLSALLFDFFVFTSPVVALFAIGAARNPRWRERPKNWRKSKIVSSFAYEWLSNHVIRLAALGSISTIGLVALGLHLLNVV